MQLAAYGAQDIYLTGNPQITFFKFVYKRHTNFAMESIKQTLNGNVDFGNKVYCNLDRKGDLVHKMFLEFYVSGFGEEFGFNDSICANLGSAIIDQIDLKIGGQLIDRHYGHWLEVYANLTLPITAGGFRASIAQIDNDGSLDKSCLLFQSMSCMGGVQGNTSMYKDNTLNLFNTRTFWVPLQFWFCRHPAQALPLIALQYHEVTIDITFQQREYCKGPGNAKLNCDLWCDYIYLDIDDRRRFAQENHQYLIEQLQFIDSKSNTRHKLNFNHPVKELIWTGGVTLSNTWQEHEDGSTGIDTTRGPSTPEEISDTTYTLKINGLNHFSQKEREYFTLVQIWEHHTGFGGHFVKKQKISSEESSIAVYSFALKPEEHQPSGTCNFSRIDNSYLVMGTAGPLYIYAVNYNILRIMSGMAGIVYTN